ncbi:MAG: response regulator transcription factor [Bacteroidales bacterium]|nr:response regulator transcription factor [Bacteroidales bacterium]
MEKKSKIFIVDDHELFRKGFAMVVNTFDNVELCGEASNGKEFLEIIGKVDADLVFMDIKMPEMNGIDATKAALEIKPGLKIVALSMFGEERYLQSMIEAGVVGFLLKDVQREELEIAIKLILDGKNYYSEELLSYFTKKYISNKQDIDISKRELEIMQLVAKGLTNQEISDKLYISLRTVEGHKTNLIQKTGSKNIVDLLIYAIKNNLIEL